LIAPKYKWDALPSLVAKDPYLKSWNDTIVGNATVVLGQDPLAYMIDGGLAGSGVVDIARETKLGMKSLAYAYRVSNETKYADRAWRELQVHTTQILPMPEFIDSLAYDACSIERRWEHDKSFW